MHSSCDTHGATYQGYSCPVCAAEKTVAADPILAAILAATLAEMAK